jgi:hypothetical protein
MARMQDFTPFIPGLPGAFSGPPAIYGKMIARMRYGVIRDDKTDEIIGRDIVYSV